MLTVAVILPSAAQAFSAYLVLHEVCEPILVDQIQCAVDLDVRFDVIFVDAGLLAVSSSKAAAALRSSDACRVIVLLSASTGAVDARLIPPGDVRVCHGPLTSALAQECLAGLLDHGQHSPSPTGS